MDNNRQSYTPGWIGGAVLIILGIIFLIRNITGFELDNWWALFILIPAVLAFARVFTSYQSEGRLTAEGRSSLIGGLVLLFVASVFLLGLDWGVIWPVFIILGGLALLINTLLPS